MKIMASCCQILAFFIALSCPYSSINSVLAAAQWPFSFGANMIAPLPKPELPPIILTPPPHFAPAPLLPPAMVKAPAPAPALRQNPRSTTLPPTSRLHGRRMPPLGNPKSQYSPQNLQPSSPPAVT
ncbi:hypothetical protein ACOSP7_004725 [Xanthoceras sorbifolium]